MQELRALLKGRFGQRGAKARLAELTGIDAALLGRYADDRYDIRPSPRNLERLAPFLGCSYEDLLKMAGYLPGEPDSSAAVDPLLSEVAAEWPSLPQQVRHVIAGLARYGKSIQASRVGDVTAEYNWQNLEQRFASSAMAA
jgi:transcriptional regulator with XRE-family HTH domain